MTEERLLILRQEEEEIFEKINYYRRLISERIKKGLSIGPFAPFYGSLNNEIDKHEKIKKHIEREEFLLNNKDAPIAVKFHNLVCYHLNISNDPPYKSLEESFEILARKIIN